MSAPAKRAHPKYSFEFENLGWEDPYPGGHRWRCIDTVIAEGDSLTELIDNATVFLIDQDGGNAGYWTLGDLPVPLAAKIYDMFRAQMEVANEQA